MLFYTIIYSGCFFSTYIIFLMKIIIVFGVQLLLIKVIVFAVGN